jgi:hypothetical protein
MNVLQNDVKYRFCDWWNRLNKNSIFISIKKKTASKVNLDAFSNMRFNHGSDKKF